jgi:PAS domain S-box-containing protein
MLIYRVPDPRGAVGIDLAGNPDSAFSQHVRSGKDRTSRTALDASTGRKALFALQTIRPVAGPADGFLVASFSRDRAAVLAPWRESLFDQVALLAGIALVTSLGLLVYQRRRGTIARLEAAREEDRRREEEAARRTEALRERERRFRTMANGAPVLIWMAGPDKLCNWFNEPWLAFTGRRMEQEMGNGWAEGVHPDDLQRCLDVYVGHFDRREPFLMEYRLRRHDGAYRWLVDTGKPLFDPDGTFTGYIGSCIDIDDAKRAAELLREREERLRAFFETSAVGIAITSPQKGWVEVNDQICEMLGYPREELTRNTWLELTHPDDIAPDVQQFNRVLSGEIEGYSLDKRFIRKDGAVVWTLLSLSCVRRADRSVEYFVAILKDISRRKEAEEALHLQQAHLDTAAVSGKLGLWDLDSSRTRRGAPRSTTGSSGTRSCSPPGATKCAFVTSFRKTVPSSSARSRRHTSRGIFALNFGSTGWAARWRGSRPAERSSGTRRASRSGCGAPSRTSPSASRPRPPCAKAGSF